MCQPRSVRHGPPIAPFGGARVDRGLEPHLLLDHAVEQTLAAFRGREVGTHLLGQLVDPRLHHPRRDRLLADPHQHRLARSGGLRGRLARLGGLRRFRRFRRRAGQARRHHQRDQDDRPQPASRDHWRTTHTFTVAVTPPKNLIATSYTPSCFTCSGMSIWRRSTTWPARASASATSAFVIDPNSVSSSLAWAEMLT